MLEYVSTALNLGGLMASVVVVHELGHALMAAYHGLKPIVRWHEGSLETVWSSTTTSYEGDILLAGVAAGCLCAAAVALVKPVAGSFLLILNLVGSRYDIERYKQWLKNP